MSPQKNKQGFPDKSSVHQDTPYKPPRPSTPNRRDSKLWIETVAGFSAENYDRTQIKRQEAIYELFKGENDMIDDLEMVKRVSTMLVMQDVQLVFLHILVAPLGMIKWVC